MNQTVEIIEFLDLLYGSSSSGYLSIWSRQTKASRHFPCKDLQAIADFASRLDFLKEDVYFGVGLREADLGPGKRGKGVDVSALCGLWADVDVLSPAHESKAYPPDEETALKLIDDFVLPPTVVVHSGYGFQVWWLFNEIQYINDEPSRRRMKMLSSRFSEAFTGFVKTSGYEIDNTSDLARVLRIPGTHNHKRGESRKVECLTSDGPYYSLSEFQDFLKRPRGKEREFDHTKETFLDPAPHLKGSDPIEVLKQKLDHINTDKHRDLCQAVLKEQPFAQIGNRDNALQSLCCIIANCDPDTDPEILVELLRPSLEAMKTIGFDPNNPPPTVENAIDKIERAQVWAKKTREHNEELRRALRKQNFHNRDEPYSDEEIEKWAELHKCPAEKFRQRWVIYNHTSFYIFREGSYLKPIIQSNLIGAVHQHLVPVATVTLRKACKNGSEGTKTIDDIKCQYGTIASQIFSDLSLQYSYYDEERDIFNEAICPLRTDLVPQYNNQIQEWLECLGGSSKEKLLDWIATVTDLSQQSAALFLSGTSSAGKTLLAMELGKLWNSGGASQLDRALGNFNEVITNCPLLLADEGVANCSKNVTTTLRSLIGTASRNLSRKYVATTTLRGAIRLIVTANDDGALFEHTKESFSKDDIQAIASRFVHIKVTNKPAQFLKSIGGRNTVEKWIQVNAIARHALWLRDNRSVTLGKRFLVEGEESSMHRTILLKNSIENLVIEWLVKHLTAKSESFAKMQQQSLILFDQGDLLVRTSALIDEENWRHYIKSLPMPPHSRLIGKALRNISDGIVRREIGDETPRFHKINLLYLQDWIEANDYGDFDVILKRITNVIPFPKVEEETK